VSARSTESRESFVVGAVVGLFYQGSTMRAALLGLAFAAATSFAVAEKKEESDDPFDFDDEADGDDGDFDDSDTGYGKVRTLGKAQQRVVVCIEKSLSSG
jgi:hypothetical protein